MPQIIDTVTAFEVAAAVIVACLLLVAVLVRRAPYGYEDETGFHDGLPPSRRFERETHDAQNLPTSTGERP